MKGSYEIKGYYKRLNKVKDKVIGKLSYTKKSNMIFQYEFHIEMRFNLLSQYH